MSGKRIQNQKRKFQIILVDDHPIMREGFTQLINNEPDLNVCAHVGNATKAFDLIGSLKPDLAIVDIALDGSSGIELIKNVRSRWNNQLLLALSMHEESVYGERALRAGACGYVMKNETTEEIMKAIREVLRGEIYLSKQMRSLVVQKFLNGEPAHGHFGVEQLSDRELEVFQLIGSGRRTSQIAAELHLSIKTVETYRAHIKEKLMLRNGMELVRHAIHWMNNQ
jgi:DNA-binding NarL/FixJ family response regulator